MAISSKDWRTPTLALCAFWAAATILLVGAIQAFHLSLPPFIAKVGPFVLAGYLTGRFVSIEGRLLRSIAAALLALVAALGWTAFTLVSTEIAPLRALVLFAASLPVMLIASLWAYFGMYLGSPRDPADEGDQELMDVERELRAEIDEQRAGA